MQVWDHWLQNKLWTHSHSAVMIAEWSSANSNRQSLVDRQETTDNNTLFVAAGFNKLKDGTTRHATTTTVQWAMNSLHIITRLVRWYIRNPLETQQHKSATINISQSLDHPTTDTLSVHWQQKQLATVTSSNTKWNGANFEYYINSVLQITRIVIL